MRLAPATAVGASIVLGAGVLVLLGHGRHPVVVAGGVGLVIGAAMLALTALVAWWRISVVAVPADVVAPGVVLQQEQHDDVGDARTDLAA